MKIINLVILCTFIATGSYAEDWPNWRGAKRDGTWTEKGIIQKFNNSETPAKWTVPIGAGYTGPTVANGKVFVMDRQTAPKETERVLCFNEKDGSPLWTFEYDCEYLSIGYPAGPRSSVIIDGDFAYSLGAMGHLHCLEASSGKAIWKKDLNKEYEINMPIWGIAAAPLIVENKIILQIGGSNNAAVLALDKTSGKEIWRNLNDAIGYSAPIIIQQGNKKVVVVWTGDNVNGLDLETGELYWQEKFDVGSKMAIADPVIYKDYIFLSSFYSGSMLLQYDKTKPSVTKIWHREGINERKTDALHCVMNTPLLKDNYIYGVDSYGEMRCLDLLTGDRIWEDLTAVNKNRWANIYFVQNGDFTWMFNEHGELLITTLSPDGLRIISRSKIIEPTTKQLNRKGKGVTWAHPAFANQHIFVRNDAELRCIDLRQK